MDSSDITVAILREIRDEIRQTNARLDETRTELSARIDKTNSRIDETNRRLTESEIRTATAIQALAGTLNDVKQLLMDRLNLNDRVVRCEHDIEELKRKVG